MDLTQLEMFNAVAEAGSITQAAAKVHRVPSNLTTRLRQLETELGVDHRCSAHSGHAGGI